jgi:hypothetical protein
VIDIGGMRVEPALLGTSGDERPEPRCSLEQA